MIVTTHLRQLLTERPIVLWVEDAVTRVYVESVWQDDDSLFQILVAGGSASVSAVVHDLRGQGYGHVFGFADRDFGVGNVNSWDNPASTIETFRPSRYELENFLLDWPALEGCRENRRFSRTAGQIQERATEQAERMVWWMACRRVLSDYWRRLVGTFPQDPKVPHITNQAEAETYLLTHQRWWPALSAVILHIQDREQVVRDLVQAHEVHGEQIKDGTWIDEFSGKEVFRSLRGYLFNEVYGSDELMDMDLAKSVGQWQFTHERVPREIRHLKAALKARTVPRAPLC